MTLLQARLPTESMEPIEPSRVREASGACAFTLPPHADLLLLIPGERARRVGKRRTS